MVVVVVVVCGTVVSAAVVNCSVVVAGAVGVVMVVAGLGTMVIEVAFVEASRSAAMYIIRLFSAHGSRRPVVEVLHSRVAELNDIP